MSQADYQIADQPGASFLSELNAHLQAIVTQNSGATEPSPTYAYQLWADTTSGKLKMRNGSNTAWLDVMTLANAQALAAAAADNATNLTGTSTSNIPTPALGSGTANSTTFLRGDRTWAAAIGRLVNIVRITTPGSGTYNKPANVTRLLIRALGAGGSGASGTNTVSGGGAGGYAEKFITSPSSSYNYTVGAGGAGVSSGNAGNAGGSTTIAGITASGGAGGTIGSGAGAAGGTASGGDINIVGGAGMHGNTNYIGSGGSSTLAGGGTLGTGKPGFGAGSASSSGGTSSQGGDGYIEIWEFE